jgi:hypothetical protein
MPLSMASAQTKRSSGWPVKLSSFLKSFLRAYPAGSDMGLTDDAVRSAESMLVSMEKDIKLSSLILDKDPRIQHFSKTHLGNTIRSALVAKLWRAEGRQTLVMHPEVVQACRLASSNKIPLEILRAIPYQNPMVVFADPPVIPTWRNLAEDNPMMPYDGEVSMRLLGFMCYSQGDTVQFAKDFGEAGIRQITMTTDPLAPRFGVSAIFQVLDAMGRVIDTETSSFSMPYERTDTMINLVDDQIQRFEFVAVENPVRARIFVTEAYRAILTSLMYLASTTLDAEKVPSRATVALGKRTIARKPLSMYRIGWTVGAALTRYRQERQRENPGQQGDIRHQQDPQHRRAHFKVAWCGPGRSIPKTVFIAPYWTHRERLGVTGINTVRRVPKVG